MTGICSLLVIISVILGNKPAAVNGQASPSLTNEIINQCTACDWQSNFCGWQTSPSVTNGTVHWVRVENFYPTSKFDPTKNEDANDLVITSSARRKASYFSGQWVEPSTVNKSSTLIGQTPSPVVNSNDINLESCTQPEHELPPKAYTARSSLLQIFSGGIGCDGEIVAWRYVSLPSTSVVVRQVYASVWEPLGIDSTVLTLVGWNLLPVGAFNEWQQINIKKQDRIRVKKGQFIGLHYGTISLRHEFAVVAHLEVVDNKQPYSNTTMTAHVFNLNHADIEGSQSVKINPSTASRRLPALRVVVRTIRPESEFKFFGDYYITAEALPALPVIGSARIKSPEIQPVNKLSQFGQCLFFKYFLKHGGTSYAQRSSLTVWLVSQDSSDTSDWENLLTRNSETISQSNSAISSAKHSPVSPPWSYGAVKISRRDLPYTIIFEASPAIGGVVALGSVEITPEPCTYTRETDILIPISSVPYGLLQNGMRWQDGEIPYVIDKDFTTEEKRLIEDSMDQFRGRTCINFKPYILGGAPSWSPYVRFRRPNAYCSGYNEPVCASFVGPQSPETLAPFGEHPVFLDQRCFYPQGVILHLLMHVVGLWHETNRPSRDQFVTINWQNIVWHHKSDFELYLATSQSYTNVNEFDFDSVTHLSPIAYSEDHYSYTVAAIDNPRTVVGQRYKLSDGDINKVNWLYSSYKSCSRWPDETKFIASATKTANNGTTSIKPPTTTSIILNNSSRVNGSAVSVLANSSTRRGSTVLLRRTRTPSRPSTKKLPNSTITTTTPTTTITTTTTTTTTTTPTTTTTTTTTTTPPTTPTTTTTEATTLAAGSGVADYEYVEGDY